MGRVLGQDAGPITWPPSGTGMIRALRGSTILCLCASFRGTRPGSSSKGGAISEAFTVPCAMAMRTVRVMVALAEVVA